MQTLNEKIEDLLRQKVSDPDASIKVCNNVDAACANGIWFDFAQFQDGHVEVWELSGAEFVGVHIHEFLLDDVCLTHEIERDGDTVSARAYASGETSYIIVVNKDLTIFVKSTSENSTDRETYKTFVDFQKGF